MAKRNQGLTFTRFLSRLLGRTTRPARKRSPERQQPRTQTVAEHLEDRALLTLVGVDFGGGVTPANWAPFTGSTDGVISNLSDETGAATGINLAIDFDELPGAYDVFSPVSSEIPAHTQSLVGLDNNYEDQGSVQLTYQNLAPGVTYDLYIFAGDTFADTQRVTITDEAAGGSILTVFEQPHGANQLIVNDQVGDSSRALTSYAIGAPADANGEINITVDSGNGTFFSLAGVALGIPTPPSDVYLNEIVADIPGGADNPNEYVELRGTVGQSLNDVYLVFVDGNDAPSQGEIRGGTAGVVDLSGSVIGANGFLAIVDDAADPYSVDGSSGVVNVPGLDIDDASYSAFLVYVDPISGTAPVSGQDLDAGNDGLDVLPTGWSLLDSVSVLDGGVGSRAYAPIAFSPTADGFLEPGGNLVSTGFGAPTNHVMRVGDTTGSQPADWVAFELADTAPDLTVAQSTNAAYLAGSIITDHVGATNPTSKTPPPPSVSVSILDFFISENGGSTTAVVTRNTDTTNPLTVNLMSDDTSEAVVVGSVTIDAGRADSDPFAITAVDDVVVDGTQLVTITAQAAGHQDGSDTLQVLDDEAELTVSITDASIVETDGSGATTATVTRNTDTTNPLVVTLMSDDTTEARVIGSVTIPAGESTSPAFDIDAVDDAILDGTQTATITASAFGHNDGTATVDVIDDESRLVVTIADTEISEGAGAAATTATIMRTTGTVGALTVTLTSSDTTEAIIQSTVVIPNGDSEVTVPIDAVDDLVADGTRRVIITATAADHVSGGDDVNVLDDEAAQLTVTITDSQIGEGDGPAATTATVSRNTDVSQALTVDLMSDDTSEATVVATVTIPAGAVTSPAFDIDAVDDILIDGTQTVTISAQATVTGGTASQLDATFGTNGLAAVPTTAFFAEGRTAVQSDGKIIAAFANDSGFQLEVFRYNPDGTADTAFGINGRTTIPTLHGEPRRIVVQQDGRILIGSQVRMTRLNADGSVDTSFATNGTLLTQTTLLGLMADFAVRADGRILLASFGNSFVQLRPDGVVDGTFGNSGTASDSSSNSAAENMVMQSDGSFIVYRIGTATSVEIVKHQADGSRDTSFGLGGTSIVDIGTDSSLVRGELALDASGRIVGTSGSAASGARVTVFRLLGNGNPDTSFGTNGVAEHNIGPFAGSVLPPQVSIQQDGKILIGASVEAADGSNNFDAAILRLNDDGSADAAFDDDGLLTFAMPETRNIFQGVADIVLDASGSLYGLVGAQDAFALAKLSTGDVVLQGSSTVDVLDDDLGSWFQEGPAPTQNAQLEPNTQPNRQVTGAIHTVLAHPTDADIMWIGGVNGGIWRTNDATSVNPTWIPQIDAMPSLAMGAMAFDPTDASYNTIVAGTARYSSFAGLGGRGGFVYRTTNGGNTWTQLAASGVTAAGENISGIAARGDEIVLTSSATVGGIYRSTDGGATFSPVVSADFSAFDNFTDLVEDTSDPTRRRLYAAGEGVAGSGGIYRSDDFGVTWTKVTGPVIHPEMNDLLVQSNNIEMAVHPTSGRLYVAVLVSGQPRGVFHSSNASSASPTWTQMDVPVLPFGQGASITGATNAAPIEITSAGHGLASGQFVVIDGIVGNTAANGFHRITVTGPDTFELDGTTGNGAYGGGGSWERVTGPNPRAKDIDETGAQGRIHFSIAVDPTNENIVYIGGDRQDRPSAIGDSTFGGAVFRGDARVTRNPNVAPSPQWSHITHDIVVSLDPNGGTANGTAPHADSREITFDANGNLIETDDGGVYRRTSPRDNTGDWFSLAGSLAVIEFHDIAYDSLTQTIVGGTQDNGTHFQITQHGQLWDFMSGGDGGDVVIDNVTLAASNQSIRYGSFQNLGAFYRRTFDQNNNQVGIAFPSLTLQGGGIPLVPQFKTPIFMNVVDPARLLIQGQTAIYESLDMGDTITEVGGFGFAGFSQDAGVYGGFQNGTPNTDVFYVGIGDEIRSRTGGGVTTVDPNPSDISDIRDIAIDTDDWSQAYAIDSDQVYHSSDAGSTWIDVTGDLPAQAGDFRSMVYLATQAADALLVGTNAGVFASFTSSIGTWFKLGTGLPNALSWDLVYDAGDDILVNGTLGRGAWSLQQVSQVLPTTPDVFISDVTVAENGLTASFDVTLATPAVNTVTLQLTTSDGTAVAGSDYTPTTDTVTIQPGFTSATSTFDVSIINDFVPELPETFTVSVASVLTGSVGDTSDVGIGTILDNEATITVDIAANSILESDGVAATTATVTRNSPTTAPVVVTLMSNDTSEATVIGSVTIPTGQASVTVDIDAIADGFVDGDQTVTISGTALGHIAVTDTVDVLDVDTATLSVSIADAFITESDGPAATTGVVTRNTDPVTAMVVNLMSDDTTEATVVASVTIPAGDLSAPFDIDAEDDLAVDGTMTVTITASAAGFVDGTDTVDVIDDETPFVTLEISDTTIDENGGVANVTAVLNFASTVDVTVDLGVAGTATGGGVDYSGPAPQLTIPAGQLVSNPTSIVAIDEGIDEVDETVIVSITGTTNATVDSSFENVTTTILDGNPEPTVSIVPTNTSEVEGDNITYTLSLSAVSSKDVTIDLAIGGTATGFGVDYTEPPLQAVIPAGSSFVVVTVPTTDDDIDEGTETVILGMTSITNGVVGNPSQVAVDLLDGDPTPVVRLSVSKPQIPEDLGAAEFTATLSAVSGRDVTVNLTTTGTATGGLDYTVTQTQLLIPAGRLTATTTLSAIPDDLDEFDETAGLRITSAVNADFRPVQQAETLIIDQDIEPTVTLSSSVSAIPEDGGAFQFFATLDAVSGKDVTVNLLLSGDALEGTDYISNPASPISVQIPAGSLSVPIDVSVVDDVIDEFNEVVILEFVSVVNAVENIVQQATVVIVDNDAPPMVDIAVTPLTIDEVTGPVSTVTASLTDSGGNPIVSGKTVAVNLLIGGNATLNADYSITSTTVVIPAGNTSGTVQISPIDDLLDEFDETIDLSIDTAVNANASGSSAFTVTILDNESLPEVSLSVDNSTVNEDGSTATWTATLSEVSGRDVTVDLLFGGSATRGTDYTDSGTQILIPAGSMSASLTVATNADLLDEFDENIIVDIDSATHAVPGSVTQAVSVIIDDDPEPTVSVFAGAATVAESDIFATFTFALSEVSGRDITVDFSLSGTATVGDDYSDPGGQIVIPAGQASVNLPLLIVNDARDEFDEDVIVDLVSADFAIPGASLQAVTTIVDDDPEPTVSLSMANPTIAEAGGTTTLTASLSATSNKEVTVNLFIQGTATIGTDYIDFGSTIVIPAGTDSVSVPVTALDDGLDEFTETINVSAQSVVNGVSDGVDVTTVIIDDDVPTLTLTIDPTLVNESAGSGAALATVTRNTNPGSNLTVTIGSNDTSEANVQNSSVLIPFGQVSATFPIDVFDDLILDGTQTVTFTASAPLFVDGEATLDVTDATVEVNLEVDTMSATEAGQTVVTVTARTVGPAVGDQTFGLAVTGAGITAGDYVLGDSTLTIGDGQTTASTTFTVVDDAIVEALTEVATISLTNLPVGLAAGGTPTQSIAITDNDSATLSIDDVTLDEGDTGVTTFTFTVTLDTAVDTAVSVDYSTTNDTALVADNDYVASAGTLTFAGQMGETQTLSVSVIADQKVELDESFLVDLSSIVAGGRDVTFSDSQGQGSITNDDAATLVIGDVVVDEGDAGDTTFTFTVLLDAEVDVDIPVDFATAEGTATLADNDFTANSGSLLFVGNSGGPQTMAIDVLVTGDTTVELDEDFLVDLSNLIPMGRDVTVADSQAIGTIRNDDHATLSVDDVTANEGDSGSSVYTFTVTLDLDVDVSVSVDYATADGTASAADGDYVGNNAGSLAFAGSAGETQTIAVVVNGDTKVELDEIFNVALSNVAAGGRSVAISGPGIGSIINDDSATLAIDDVVLAEGDFGTTSAIFTVTLDGEVDTLLNVDYATQADSASDADADYVDSTGTLTFAPNLAGPQTRTLAVPVTGDTKVELDESFLVDLSNLLAGGRDITFTDAQGTGVITNDDTGTISINDVALDEGDLGTTFFTFTVTLDAEVDTSVTVDFDTQDASASTGDADYVANTGNSLTFGGNSGGSQTQTVSVAVPTDRKVELDETFLVNLSNIMAAGRSISIGDGQGIGTIQNDDSATLSINDVALNEGDVGDSFFVFTVTLDNEVDTDVGVGYTTNDQTAASGDNDYIRASGVLNFPSGGNTQTQTLSVTANGDQKVELNEAFLVNLFNINAAGRNVTFSDFQGIGTLVNDDSASISIDDISVSEGDAGPTLFTFTVTLDAETDTDVTFDVDTADQTTSATGDNDYTPIVGGSGGFVANNGPGIQTHTIGVMVNGDEKVELDETFRMVLSNLVTNGRAINIVDGVGLATVTNDDSATISIDDVSQVEGDIGNSLFTFTVTLDTEVDAGITVDYSTADGTALSMDSDYVPQNGNTLSFAANAGTGPQTATLSIQVTGDEIVELDETFLVNLSNLMNAGRDVTISNPQGTGTIENDETAGFSIDDVSLVEGDVGAQVYVFTVTLDTRVDRGISLNVATQDSTANAADYTPQNSGLNFNGQAGETRTVGVVVNGDQVTELDENFFVNLSVIDAGGRDFALTKGQGVGTILNDDSATLSINDVTVTEGDSGNTTAQFTVTLNGRVDTNVLVGVQTSDGTATVAGNDYLPLATTLTFPSGTPATQIALTADVSVVGDDLVERDETFFANLVNLNAGGRNVTISDGQGLGTITHDDRIDITISDALVVEGPAPGSTFLTFNVVRSNTTVPLDLSFVTVDGSAIGGSDYVARNGVLNFPAGAPNVANIVVEVLGDNVQENTENLFVLISSTDFGADIADPQAVGTIVQDDGFISGQKWHDLDEDGVHDPNEPGLDGWVIEARDAAGNVIASATTLSLDLNNDGMIDPFSEQGLYTIPINSGTWDVAEVLQPGWRQTFPDGGDALAFQLDQQHNLRFTGNLFENWGGQGEKWTFGNGGWYYITPAGNVFRWNGSPRNNISGEFLGSVGRKFHATPSLLYDAQPPGARSVTVRAGEFTQGVDFGNVPTGSITGRKSHDVDANGAHDASEPWLNGWEIVLRNEAGDIVATTLTQDIDLNGDGVINPKTERGVYRFRRLIPGTYSVSEETRANWTQGGTDRLFSGEAYFLNLQLNFREPRNDFLNWGGRNEKWLWSNNGWHFVTPNGRIFEWDGSARTNLTGTLVASFNSDYWQDLSLIYNSPRPATFVVDIVGQELTGIDFANTFGHDGTGSGNVVTAGSGGNVTITGDAQDNTFVVYQTEGQTWIQGAGQTTVNGSAGPILLGNVTGINAASGDGHDQIVFVGLTGVGLGVQTGTGNDTTVIGGSSLGAVNLVNSAHADEVRVIASQLAALSVGSDGLTAVMNSGISGDLNVNANGNGNTIFLQNAMVGGATSVHTGSAADWIISNRSQFGGNVSVISGNGADLTAVRNSQIAGTLLVEGRGGNDTIGLSHGTSAGAATVRGGGGTDTFASDGTSTVATLSSIENSINSDMESLIDLALSNFDDLMLDA